MNATVLPFVRRSERPDNYSRGWIDGARYVERVGAWRWRLEGVALGAILVALILR